MISGTPQKWNIAKKIAYLTAILWTSAGNKAGLYALQVPAVRPAVERDEGPARHWSTAADPDLSWHPACWFALKKNGTVLKSAHYKPPPPISNRFLFLDGRTA